MHLRKHDLLQMDDEWLKKLPAELLLEVSKRLLHDVKELQNRLNQSPTNSSRPPTSRAPWGKPRDAAGEASDARVENPREAAAEPATDAADSTAEPVKANVTPSSSPKGSSKPRGKQPCSPGHGCTQKLVSAAITDTCEHRPERCVACGEALAADAWSQAYTARDEINIAAPLEGRIGPMLGVTRHTLVEVGGTCGHISRALPWRAGADAQWEQVELGEWRLDGPRLAGIIVFLALRLRLSRARIRELLMERFDLTLSTGVIDETIREAGRASVPLEDALVADIVQAAQRHVDETSWPESGVLLCLWALVTTHTVLFLIGPRRREMLENALQDGYLGILIRW